MRYLISFFLIFSICITSAQSVQSVSKKDVSKDVKQDWHNLDYKEDKINFKLKNNLDLRSKIK